MRKPLIFRQLFSVLLFAVLAFSVLNTVAQAPKGSLRVMTFNIRYDEPRDGVNAWPNRKQKVADVIRFHKADLVGVQEALLTQLRDLEGFCPILPGAALGERMEKKPVSIRQYCIGSHVFSSFRPTRSGSMRQARLARRAGTRLSHALSRGLSSKTVFQARHSYISTPILIT